MSSNISNQIKKFPKSPGVYLFSAKGGSASSGKNDKGKIIYIGKAASLYDRVSSYWRKSHNFKHEQMLSEIKSIDYKKTASVIEALILETELVKKYQPKYNSRLKDDKSFLYVGITKEDFPRIVLLRKTDLQIANMHECGHGYSRINLKSHSRKFEGNSRKLAIREAFGPFVSASSLKSALQIIRRIFPYRSCRIIPKTPCLYAQIKQCPAPCIGNINPKDYNKTISNIILLFKGKKGQIIKKLEAEMKKTAKQEEFEKAGEIKKQIFALKHVRDTALIIQDEDFLENKKFRVSSFKFQVSRIEGYDISNLGKKEAVGSMVVFENKKPLKSGYRKFKIKTVAGINDAAMLKEILNRRLKHRGWPLPDLILIDGGKPQVSAAEKTLKENNIKITVVGIAKGLKRRQDKFIIQKYSPFVQNIKNFVQENSTLLKQIRDEAHRFAVKYLRSKIKI